MTACLFYVTAKNMEEAKKIGRTLVAERLCACINILGDITSLYWWNDEVQDETETAFLIKTTTDKADKVIQRVQEIHSYECPCIVALPIEKGSPDFLDWIKEQTSESS